MPLVLDTHELHRQPGAMRTVSVDVHAPGDLRTEVIGVTEGSELHLELRLESVLEGILVSGTVQATAVGECARCLERLERTIEVAVQELFAYPGHQSEDTSSVDGDLIDLEPAVRDAIVTELPLAPVCRDDCPGLCPECGALLAEEPDHSHETIDPRWSSLQALAADGTSDGGIVDHQDENDEMFAGSMAGSERTNARRDPAATSNDDRSRAGRPKES